MNLSEFIQKSGFEMIHWSEEADRALSGVFCCDLLSIAMSKAPADCVWVTVMGNVNAVAVCVLAETGCLVLAEGASLDENALEKARQHNVAVLKSPLPVFDTALRAHQLLCG